MGCRQECMQGWLNHVIQLDAYSCSQLKQGQKRGRGGGMGEAAQSVGEGENRGRGDKTLAHHVFQLQLGACSHRQLQGNKRRYRIWVAER